MQITEQKQTQIQTGQLTATSEKRDRIQVWGSETQTTVNKTNQQQGYPVEHRGIQPSFVIALNGVKSMEIPNQYVVYLKQIEYYTSTIPQQK